MRRLLLLPPIALLPIVLLPLMLLGGCIEAPVVDRWGRETGETRSWPDLDGSQRRSPRELGPTSDAPEGWAER